jgi:hypothetical protein
MFRHAKSNFPSFQKVVPLRVAVLWILCVLLGDAVAGSRLVTKLDAGEKQTVVTYGTSLTAGGAWVAQVREALSKKYPGRLTVINSGQGSMWVQVGCGQPGTARDLAPT